MFKAIIVNAAGDILRTVGAPTRAGLASQPRAQSHRLYDIPRDLVVDDRVLRMRNSALERKPDVAAGQSDAADRLHGRVLKRTQL